MRERTTTLHAAAERSGIIAALFGGTAERSDYALYLRSLLPAYQAMEFALRLCSDRPEFHGLAQPCLYRAASIIADLERLVGPRWAVRLPLLPSASGYAAAVRAAARGPRLIAHCYTRYLGDLNGGQMLGRHLINRFGPDFPALAFTGFPQVPDIHTFRGTYRIILDQAGSRLADPEPVIEEAVIAFQLNIELSLAVEAFHTPASLAAN